MNTYLDRRCAVGGLCLLMGVAAACLPSCRCDKSEVHHDAAASGSTAPSPSSPHAASAGPVISGSASPALSVSAAPSASKSPRAACPKEMLLVPGSHPVCVDRWENILVDKTTGERLSPYYPPSKRMAVKMYDRWQKKRWEVGSAKARNIPLPPLPAWQREHEPVVMAQSKPHEIPNGYVSGKIAKIACANAGKRLCRRSEWVHACEGRVAQQFPYGEQYKRGSCNIFRFTHPSGYLHDDVTRGHLDPRLNLVRDKEGPLLRRTGTTATCVSRWDQDGLYDMVGNLDEWVEDPKGMFVGGFYSRAKRDGCKSVVKNHPIYYFDYSLGVRCCKDLK